MTTTNSINLYLQGIPYYNGHALFTAADTATANQILLSGSNNTPSFSTSTYPSANAINTLLYASSANVMAALATTNRASLSTNSTGVPTWLALTDGQIVIGSTAGAPAAATLTQGANISITNASNSITIAATSGAGSPLTTKGDIYVYSTTNTRLPVGTTDGQILQVSSGAATGLAYSTPTYPSASGAAGKILRSDGTNNVYSTSTFADTYSASTLLYSNGANTVTGLATANSASLVTNSSGVPAWSGTMTNGQVIIGSTGGTPTAATLTQGANITITNGGGTITIAAATQTSPMNITGTTVVTGTSQTLVAGNAYYSNNAGLVTFTLPSTATVGDVFEIGGLGAGGWTLVENASQLIHFNSSTTTTSSGSLSSTNRYDSISFRCIVANTTFNVFASSGVITVV